jgi:hypothetical protein
MHCVFFSDRFVTCRFEFEFQNIMIGKQIETTNDRRAFESGFPGDFSLGP